MDNKQIRQISLNFIIRRFGKESIRSMSREDLSQKIVDTSPEWIPENLPSEIQFLAEGLLGNKFLSLLKLTAIMDEEELLSEKAYEALIG